MQTVNKLSRFVVGTAKFRALTMEALENTPVQFDAVAALALGDGESSQKVRLSIERLADAESAWFRKTPPHILVSDKVLHSRQAEIAAFVAVNASVLAAFSHKDGPARELEDRFVSTYQGIDNLPGTAASKTEMITVFEREVALAARGREAVFEALRRSEVRYLSDYSNGVLGRYTGELERSEDFSM